MANHECSMVHVGPDGETQCVRCGEGSYDNELMELDADTIAKLRATVEADRFEMRLIKNGTPYSKMQGAGKLFWLHAARQLAKAARLHGFVIRIEQAPREPLAMGNHSDRVTVCEARK